MEEEDESEDVGQRPAQVKGEVELRDRHQEEPHGDAESQLLSDRYADAMNAFQNKNAQDTTD